MANILDGDILDPTKHVFETISQDGLGVTFNMNVDGTTPKEFYFKPAIGVQLSIYKVILAITDAATTTAHNKFSGLAALSTGIDLKIKDDSATFVDLFDSGNVKDNGDIITNFDYVAVPVDDATDGTMLHAVIDFGGRPIPMFGTSTNQRFSSTVSDDLTGLVKMLIKIFAFIPTA